MLECRWPWVPDPGTVAGAARETNRTGASSSRPRRLRVARRTLRLRAAGSPLGVPPCPSQAGPRPGASTSPPSPQPYPRRRRRCSSTPTSPTVRPRVRASSASTGRPRRTTMRAATNISTSSPAAARSGWRTPRPRPSSAPVSCCFFERAHRARHPRDPGGAPGLPLDRHAEAGAHGHRLRQPGGRHAGHLHGAQRRTKP